MPLETNNKRDALIEAGKEVVRWVFFFIVSWVVTETLRQLAAVPEHVELRLWVFQYFIPVRLLLQLGLTFVGRAADKFVHEWNGTRLNGLMIGDVLSFVHKTK